MNVQFSHDLDSYKLEGWTLPVNTEITYTPQADGFPVGQPIWFDRGITNVQPDDKLMQAGTPPTFYEKDQGFTPQEYADLKWYLETVGISVTIV